MRNARIYISQGMLVAVLTLVTWINANAQQSNCAPARDPNLPGQSSAADLPIRWSYGENRTIPEVRFNGALDRQGFSVTYLGFNDRGTWLQYGAIYVWNIEEHSLIKVADQLPTLSREVILSWKNQSSNLQYMNWAEWEKGQGVTITTLPQSDPNFPCLIGSGPGIEWTYLHTRHGIGIPPDIVLVPSKERGTYLGFNAQGSWFEIDYGVSIWNRTTQSITRVANGRDGVPSDLLNPSTVMLHIIDRRQTMAKWHAASGGSATVASNNVVAVPRTPPPPRSIRGTNASVQNGVLTFTVNDPQSPENGQQKTYNVVRPANMGAAIPGMGSAGPWISQDGGQLNMFTIQGDHTVMGNIVPAAMAPSFLPHSK